MNDFKLLKRLKEYMNNTPLNQIEKDWKDCEMCDQICPNIFRKATEDEINAIEPIELFDRNWCIKTNTKKEAYAVFDYLESKGEEVGRTYFDWTDKWCYVSYYKTNKKNTSVNYNKPTSIQKQLKDILPNYESKIKEDSMEPFKVGDYVVIKDWNEDYNGRLVQITKSGDAFPQCAYFKVFDEGYYNKSHNFIINKNCRLATKEEINKVLNVKSEESVPMEQSKFPINPKLKYNIGDKVSYEGIETVIVAIDDNPNSKMPYVIKYKFGWETTSMNITRGSLSTSNYWVSEKNLVLLEKQLSTTKQSSELLDLLEVDYI